MTVLELVRELLSCSDLNATVTIGRGCGPVNAITARNGFVILDPPRPPGNTP